MHVVADRNNRPAFRAGGRNDAAHALNPSSVLARSRLIQNQDRRPHGQHGSQREQLATGIAEVVRVDIRVAGHAHGFESRTDRLVEIRATDTEVPRPKSHFSSNAARKQLPVGVLEREAHHAGEAGHVPVSDVQSAQQHPPGARPQQPVHMAYQRRLAGAVLADDGDQLARPNSKR